MAKQSNHISTAHKILPICYALCLLAFFLPASHIIVHGQAYTQYLLTAYSGWAAFSVILIAASIQAFFLYRKKQILGWLGCFMAIYIAWFALRQILESYGLNKGAGLKSLAAGMQLSSSPLSGLFLLALGGGLLFVLSTATIISKSALRSA